MVAEEKIVPQLKMKSDIMFKEFFSRKENEGFLKDFLEAIIGEKVTIKQVMHDARLEQLAKEQKYGILDLGVELENGEFINVEIQLKNFKNIEERTTFYASKKITEQLGNEENYNELKPVIIIAILDYDFIDLPDYVTDTVRVSANHREYELNNKNKYEIYRDFKKKNPKIFNENMEDISKEFNIDKNKGNEFFYEQTKVTLIPPLEYHNFSCKILCIKLFLKSVAGHV